MTAGAAGAGFDGTDFLAAGLAGIGFDGEGFLAAAATGTGLEASGFLAAGAFGRGLAAAGRVGRTGRAPALGVGLGAEPFLGRVFFTAAAFRAEALGALFGCGLAVFFNGMALAVFAGFAAAFLRSRARRSGWLLAFAAAGFFFFAGSFIE